MNLRQIKYFIAVAEEKNISRAAERLHISQPPLSRLVQILEDELGTPLFNRTTWGVELTPAGEAFLSHARKIHSLIEHTREDISNIGKPDCNSTINIGLYGTAMLTVVPNIISLLGKTHPEINVVLHHQLREHQIESLKNGKILVAFDRYLAKHTDIATMVAYKENILLAVNRLNPLSNRESVNYKELENLSLIGPIDNEAATFLEEKHRKLGVNINYVHRSTDMISGTQMVSNNFGCSIVPESMRVLKLPDVVYIPIISEPPQTMELHCAYLANNDSPLLKIMIETINQYRKENNNI